MRHNPPAGPHDRRRRFAPHHGQVAASPTGMRQTVANPGRVKVDHCRSDRATSAHQPRVVHLLIDVLFTAAVAA
jgi:hypothetical protein